MRRVRAAATAFILGLLPGTMLAECPFARSLRAAKKGGEAAAPVQQADIKHPATPSPDAIKVWREAAEDLDWAAVKEDIKAALTDSKDWWPADFGNYGPLMIRLAWHCAGSYRSSDGLGGCDGARQRFDPERSWDDNTNLDKARKLLEPIKEKYGVGLSWGDLIILSGNVAIESMGGPVLGFCGGRMDDPDGHDSLLLGPTPEQELYFPCPVNGQCAAPLGQSTIGLIYVNPEGPMGKPLPEESAINVREVFGRMNLNDSETVALIGGGHAFGKTHGACPLGAGPSPKDTPGDDGLGMGWPGKCGTGKGDDAFTSGFEGKWTSTPTEWSNEYYTNLINYKWEVFKGPGGHFQWQPEGDNPDDVHMLTADVALLHDPTGEYQKLVKLYAEEEDVLKNDFAHAWYKLTTRDMGPASRCIGPDVPPPQDFQNPLPPPSKKLADFDKVKKAIRKVMSGDDDNKKGGNKSQVVDTGADMKDGKAYYGALFTYLAWQCASTFRSTDYQGGCNGARIRFSPEKEWETNAGLDEVLEKLEDVKDQFIEGLSWADLIVLAGTVALEDAGQQKLSFCGGRTDADGVASKNLKPFNSYGITRAWDFNWRAKTLGLEPKELVALAAMPRSPKQMERLGFSGVWSNNTFTLSNSFFTTLLQEEWSAVPTAIQSKETATTDAAQPLGPKEFKVKGKKDSNYISPTDLLIKNDPDLSAVAKEYAKDQRLFLKDFAAAFTKVMNADRYDGPGRNVCDKK